MSHIVRAPGGPGGAAARTTRCASSWHSRGATFIMLGAVVLCVTGAEALYADLGHFGKRPIRLAWFARGDAGAGAQLLRPGRAAAAAPRGASKNPFYQMAPAWALLPLVVLATAATVIASQALITGAFSRHQAGDPARLPAAPAASSTPACATPARSTCPFVNWGLFVAIVLAVVMFRSSSNLASAYGIAVTHRHADHHRADLLRDPLRLEATRWRCASPRPASSSSSTSPSSRPTCSSCSTAAGSRCVIGGGMFTLMITWKQGRAPAQRQAARRRDRPAQLSSRRCSSARRRASKARRCS